MNHRRLRIGAYLSLTGPYRRFGRQAAGGLRALQALTGEIELVIEDDVGDPDRVAAGLAGLAGRCDLLLGPYSTRLMRAAARAIEHIDALLWNHGGAGDDVQTSPSGRVVSVLTPASRYAEPFLRRIARERGARSVRIVQGRGSFGRQVADGAEWEALRLGLTVERHDSETPPPVGVPDDSWDVFSAGTFEEDVAVVSRLLAAPCRPRSLCAVAAGVADFAAEVADPDGVYGISQWFPGEPDAAQVARQVGPTEAAFLAAYRDLHHAEPDYPAVQAAAAAAIAVHCVRSAGSAAPDAALAVASALDGRTLFGPFRIDAAGRQIAHSTVLVRWTEGRLARVV